MAFWDKFFRKDNKDSKSATTTYTNSEERKEISYNFKFILTDEIIQKRIIDFISPITDQYAILNLQLAYGLLETETNLFLTRIKSTNESDENTGQDYDTTYFVVLTSDGSFSASYISEDMNEKNIVKYNIPKEYEEILIKAFDIWKNIENHKNFEKELDVEDKNRYLIKRNNELRGPLYELIPQKEDIKQHFEIHSEEDAKTLFYLCNTSYYNVLKKKYDEETVKKFDEYAPMEKMTEWELEKGRGILNQILDGDTDQLYDKLRTVSGLTAKEDDLSQLYTKTCKQLFEQNIDVPLKAINSYLCLFTRRLNPLNVKELLDMTEHYLKVNFAEAYEKPELNTPEKRFKELSAELRGIIEELSPIENIHGFKYVLTSKSRLSTIVDYYSNKYNDEEAVKEVLAFLNCAYGVENKEVFVTALNDEADNIGNSDYKRYEFIAILLKDNTVVEFHCNRDTTDGSLQRGYRSIDDFPQILMDAVYYYRNKPERDAFCQKYSNTHNGASIRDLKYATHDELYATFASSFGEEMERIGDNPLADTLKELINICEKKAHEYNIENTIIEKPATWEEIEKWEQKNEIKLPKSYKDFLLFANGVQIFSSSEQIFGLDEIGRDDEYLEDDYISIGEIIGDGTMLCLSKTTQKAYVADHGEYNEKGDFEELLKYFLEFLW